MQSVVIFASVFALLACCAEIVVTQERIVEGFPIDISEAPYQVAVYVYKYFYCGGSIIGVDKILTAAHCTDGLSLNSLSVRVGATDHNDGESFSLRALHQHPQFEFATANNDICVLYLSNPLTYGPNIQPIKLARNRPEPNTLLLATGWGRRQPLSAFSEGNLQGVFLPFVSQDDCEESYSNLNVKLTDAMLCAGYTEGGKGTCYGDSGGPLVNNATKELVGIVSFGYGCARPYYYGVYASVPDLLDFIESV